MSTNLTASIIILIYNNLEITRQCLESIYAKTTLPFEMILVDNGSQDGSPEYLQALASQKSNLKLQLNETNLGFARGNNQGASMAAGKYLVFLNNDTVVTHGWLEGLTEYLQDPQVGMVGPVTNSAANESRVLVNYQNLEGMESFAHQYTTENRGNAFEIGMLGWFCVAMRRTTYTEIGPLDERFEVGMFEDDDYAMRVKQAGYKILCAEDVFVHHWGSASFSKLQQSEYWDLFTLNRKRFEEKWGKPWQPHLSRPELLHQQYREMIDDAVWRASLVIERENKIVELKQELSINATSLEQFRQELEVKSIEINNLKQQLESKEEQIGRLKAQIESSEEQIYGLNNQVEQLDDQLLNLNQQLTTFNAELDAAQSRLQEIYGSNAWAIITAMWILRLHLAPAGSRREKLLKNMIRRIKALRRYPGKVSAREKIRTRKSSGSFASRIGFANKTWYSYAFKRYKRARHSVFTTRLSLIQPPSEKGMVSIILPVFNGEKYLPEALESIFNQTYTHFELIAVDDGSTDSTPHILNHYALRDPRLRILRQENQRLPSSLSNGFRLAKGEFLTWTSDDNRLKPDYLEKLVTCLRRHADWDMVYANEDIIGDDGEPLVNSDWFLHYQNPFGSSHIELPSDPSELNTYANNYIGAAFLYRNRVFYLLGDYSPFRYGMEDYDYWMRINGLLNLFHADFSEQIYDYRFHSTSLTSQDQTLGITNNRNRLMVFDDARRDFYLTPVLWKIDAASENKPQNLLREMREWVVDARQILVDELNLANTPRFWHPMVFVYITDGLTSTLIPPPDCPPTAWKALIVVGDGPLPATVDRAWNVCITTNARVLLPRLEEPRQGWLAIPDILTLCAALDIQARSEHLSRLEAEIENQPEPEINITVVISTYQRKALLLDSILSIARQTFPAKDYEIIIVNNDPADPSVCAMVDELRSKEFSDRPDEIRLINCHFKGLSFGRNAGISEARGRVICFLDDDALAQPDWLVHIWETFELHPQAGVVGGSIDLRFPQPLPRWLKPGWEKFWSHYQPGYTQPTAVNHWWEFPWGANWCARREALLKIGGFRTRYGRKGADFGGGEELVAALQIQKLGYEIVVNPFARVQHAPDLSRYTLKHVWKTIRSGKRNQYLQQIDLYAPMELSFSSQARNAATNLKHAIWDRKVPWHERIEYLLYIWFNIQLSFKLAWDYIQRYA